MQFSKEGKANSLADDARRALTEGRFVFAPALPARTTGAGPHSVPGWAEAIEAVEQTGWVLYHWAVDRDEKGMNWAFPLFRRRP